MLLVRNLDLIRSIFITDFTYFTDRTSNCNESYDPISAHLFNLRGEKWRNLRGKLSPAFTSGKLKAIFATIEDCASRLQVHVDKYADTEKLLNLKDITSCFTTDVNASVAFGIDVDSIKNPNNEFRTFGQKLFESSFRRAVKYMLTFVQPKLLDILRIKAHSKSLDDFFLSMVKQNLDYREQNNVTRKDLFQLLIQIRNAGTVELDDQWETVIKADENQKTLTLNQITAQSLLFFGGGFESTSSTISFLLYELSKNQSIQRRVHEEIDEVLKKHDGKITYESISEMNYLDCCLDEILRQYAIPFLTRVCVSDYKIPGTELTIEKGVSVLIPVYPLHYDEKYYDEPQKFDPNRFTDDNKNQTNRPYFAFGDGPRNCIGMRLGKLQTKLALVYLLKDLRYDLSENLKKNKLVFDTSTYSLIPLEGINLYVKKR